MNRIVKTGVWILIGVVVVLPLYELADYTEVWQGDANIILPALVFLLIGMALVGGKLLIDALATVMAILSRVCDLLTPSPSPRSFVSNCATGPPQPNLLHILCDLRL
jgi:hypothetical protein